MSTVEPTTPQPRGRVGAPDPATFLGGLPSLPEAGATRPRTIPIAAALLATQAILALAGLAVSFAYRDILREEKVSADTIAKHLAGEPAAMSLFGIGCSVLLSVIFLVLAAFVLRGSNPGRIAALMFSGLGVLFGLFRILLGSPSPARSGPGWYEANSAVASIALLALVVYAAIIVLLALRPSDEYFARRPT
jgi:4-hydroxybenzoate polyprenyltransferase